VYKSGCPTNIEQEIYYLERERGREIGQVWSG